MVTPQNIYPYPNLPELVNLTLNKKRVFANVISKDTRTHTHISPIGSVSLENPNTALCPMASALQTDTPGKGLRRRGERQRLL